MNHLEVEGAAAERQRLEKWYLVDLQGYGYSKLYQSTWSRWEQMIEYYMLKRENLVKVFVLIDSRHPPQKNDLEFLQKLDKWEVPFALAFTKSDKEKPGVVKRNVEAFSEELKKTWQFLPQYFVTSAEKKIGRDEVLSLIQKHNNDLKA